MAADFFEKDFNFEKYISERLLEIDDEKTRVEMRELMQHTMIPFYRHTEEAYRGFVERYRISAEASMGSCDVITGLMKRGKIDVTDHSFVPMIPEDALYREYCANPLFSSVRVLSNLLLHLFYTISAIADISSFNESSVT